MMVRCSGTRRWNCGFGDIEIMAMGRRAEDSRGVMMWG